MNAPVEASMAAPAGAPIIDQVRVSPGRSGSVAVAVNDRVDPSGTVFAGMGSSAGALGLGVRVIARVSVSVSGPPAPVAPWSDTSTWMEAAPL
ncbi:MAG: hypothetical protein U0237_07095 [Thermoleophilia bacterium]